MSWKMKTMAEIAVKDNGIVDGPFGSNLKKSDYIDDRANGVPVLTTKNLRGDYSENSVRYISQTKYEQLKRSSVFPGDILVAKIGSIGTCGIYPLDQRVAIIPANLLKITVLPTMDRKYVYYYIQSAAFQKQIKDIATATAQPAFNVTKFRKLPIPVPPLEEQQRIVARIEELFSQLDDAEATLQKTKTQLAVYRQAVLHNAFQRTSDSREVSVADIGEVNLGRQRSPKNVAKDYPTKYIRAANITESGIDISNVLEMEFTPSEREKYYLRDGDIILSEASGSASQVGKPAIWRCQIPDCCFQNTVIRHRVVSELPEYVLWYYKYLYETGYFATVVGGVGINHLGAKNFSEIKLFIAPKNQQSKVVEQLESQLTIYDSINNTIETVKYQIQALKQSILKQFFGGEQ